MPSYPVSYRGGSRSMLGGFQVPSGSLPSTGGLDARGLSRTAAANDNWVWSAANDNELLGPVEGVGGRGLGRVIPVLGWILLAGSAWQLLLQRRASAQYNWNSAGYTLVLECDGAPQIAVSPAAFSNCNITRSLLPNTPPKVDPNASTVGTWKDPAVYPPNPAYSSWTWCQKWERIAGASVHYIGPGSWSPYDAFADAPPATRPPLNPDLMPVGQLPFIPLPVPWEVLPHLGFSVRVQSYRQGYDLDDGPVNDPDGPSDPVSPLEPPPKGTKERKFRINGNMGYLRFAYDAMSEIDDFVDAIWKSLPRNLRTRRTFYKDPFGKWHRKQVSVPEKAADIYRHYDKLDIPSAIEGVIENEIKDRIFGYVGRKQAAATRNVYRHGYGNLPRVPTVSRLTGPFNR